MMQCTETAPGKCTEPARERENILLSIPLHKNDSFKWRLMCVDKEELENFVYIRLKQKELEANIKRLQAEVQSIEQCLSRIGASSVSCSLSVFNRDAIINFILYKENLIQEICTEISRLELEKDILELKTKRALRIVSDIKDAQTRKIIKLKYIESKNVKEIAQLINKTESFVYQKISRFWK